jgi:hypothetical protein
LTARHALLVPPNPGLDPVYIDGMIDIMVIGNAIEVARDMGSTCCCRALRGMFSQTINFGQDFLQHKNPDGRPGSGR